MKHKNVSLWYKLWRTSFFKRIIYEVIGILLIKKSDNQLLNCGFQEKNYPTFDLPSEHEQDRLGYQLYHKLICSSSDNGIEDLDVLEVGCGRGGGACFLVNYFQPKTYLATDTSYVFIKSRNSRQVYPKNLSFSVAQATKLPAERDSKDIIICIESLSIVSNKEAFFTEAARVLRPGGRILIADFFYFAHHSQNNLMAFNKSIESSPFSVVLEDDWTKYIMQSLEEATPCRIKAINKYPKLIQKYALIFATTTLSPLYFQFKNKTATYRYLVLVKK